jgi:hypothetical protein
MKLDFDFRQAGPDNKEHSGELSSTIQTAVSEKSNSPLRVANNTAKSN